MRFHVAVASIILFLAGCGAVKQGNIIGANHAGPKAEFSRDSPHFPKVVFLGDDVTVGWFPPTSVWINQGIAGQTSDQVLARFQADVVSLHPAIVHILVGTNDVVPSWSFCGMGNDVGAPVVPIDTCTNIETMISEAQAAGIKVILGTIPPIGPTSSPVSPEQYVNIDELNQWITNLGAQDGIPVVDYHAALAELPDSAIYDEEYGSGLTTNGVDPNTAGYAVMTPMAQLAISALDGAAAK